MSSPAEKILITSDHPVTRQMADDVASGRFFGEIMKKYNPNPQQAAQIHEYKSRIETALKMGENIHDVINEIFGDTPQVAKDIINNIHQYKADRPK